MVRKQREGCKVWTKEEIELLRREWANMRAMGLTFKQVGLRLSIKLNRSYQSVIAQARYQKLAGVYRA